MPLLSINKYPLRGLWKLTEQPAELWSQICHKHWYEEDLAQMKSPTRQAEWLATRLLLREMLGHETRIAYFPSGAPYLPDEPFHLSLSHTKGFVALTLSEERTGIDIEYRSERVRKIRSRYLSPSEEAFIDLLHETEHLLVCWCAKEALFKVVDLPEMDFLEHLHILPFSYAPSGLLTAYESRSEHHQTFTFQYEVTEAFVWVWKIS